MDTFAAGIGDDADLDELMNRVREAALGASAGAGGSTPTTADASGEMAAADSDVARVIDAQSQLNEQMRKALADLLGCLRTLRDDWADAHKGLRREMGQLSATVRSLQRTAVDSAPARRKTPIRAARGRRAVTSRRTDQARHATKGGKQRS